MRTHVVVDDDGQEQAAAAAVAPVVPAAAPPIIPRFSLGILPLIAPPADSRRIPVTDIVSEERDAQVRCPFVAALLHVKHAMKISILAANGWAL